MRQSYVFNGEVLQGKLILKNRKKFDDYIQKFNGKRVTITIDQVLGQRSYSQNAYYWVLMTILGEHIGYLPDEMHDCCKMKFLRKNEGTGVDTTISTTRLNKTEFGEYIEKIKIWAALGEDIPSIDLPEPNNIKL